MSRVSYEACEKPCLTLKKAVPHALGGAVVEVLQELWEAQHGLKRHSQGAQRLHKQGWLQQQQGDDGTQNGEAKAEEKVILERTPLPEVVKVQVWRGDVKKES